MQSFTKIEACKNECYITPRSLALSFSVPIRAYKTAFDWGNIPGDFKFGKS